MRHGPQLYTLRFIPVPMKNGTEIKVCQENGFQPPPAKRKGPCPRGYVQDCFGCQHIHFNKLKAPFEILCTDLRLENTKVSLSLTDTSDDFDDDEDALDIGDRVRHQLHIFYRDMVILETTVTVTSTLDVSTITSFDDLRENTTSIIPMLINHLSELVETQVIHLEKQ